MDYAHQNKHQISRRDFVKGTSLSAAAFMIVPRHVLGGTGFVPPSDKVNIGIIGAGGKGRENTAAFLALEDVQVTAVADPAYYWNLAGFYYRTEAGRGPVTEMIEKHYADKTPNFKVAEYLDFRQMLDQETAMDGVVCSTPDHTHAYISTLAMRAGKHVFCEKPLTHNIWEARQVQQIARETGLATQMGNIGHSTDGIRETVEYLRAGVIGSVNEAYSWVPAGRWIPGLRGLPQENMTVPVGFDWNLWLGPREERPFNEAYVPVTWRDFWSFGCGALGDFGCHDMDAATWAFELQAPSQVQIFPAGYSDENIAPYGEIGYFEFGNQKNKKSFKLTWYSGGLRPEHHEMLPKDYVYPSRGSMFVGDKGLILNEGGDRAPKVYPESLRNSFKPPKPSIPRSNGHFRDWIDAIKGGPMASANFEYGARLTEITLLGVLSLRMGGQRIDWDANNMKAIGLPQADAFIREAARSGWEIT